MTVAIDITKEQRKTLLALLRRFIPGVAVWAYGSRVKWTARPNSDLDLVAFTTSAQRSQVADLKDALAESNLPFPVDLHVWDEVPERFREIIRKEYVVLQEAKQPGSVSNMAGWKSITLGDFVALQRGHDLTEPERRPGHIPVMGSAGQNGFHDTALAKGPGIVIGRSGASFGQVHFCTTDYWPHNTGLYVTDFKGNDPRFAYYFLKVLDLDRYNSGSAQPSLNRNFIYPIPICVPEPAEQKTIAHILGTLDDKIELNRRMNETLEAMARVLFKSWFVDFLPVRANMEARNRKARTQTGDPVRAKAEGRDPLPAPQSEAARQAGGLPKPLADLFPDSFEDSELGEIPKGWAVGSVDDEFHLTMGQSPPGETYNEVGEGLPFYQGRADFGIRFPTRRVYCNAPTRLASAGDALISVRAPVGDINIATERCAIGRGVAAARHKTGSRSYSYQFMQSIEEVFARFEGEGTVFGSIGKKDFHAIPCVMPPRDLVLAFEKCLSPIDERIEVNERESRTLATLRDTLLPKLLAGEVKGTFHYGLDTEMPPTTKE